MGVGEGIGDGIGEGVGEGTGEETGEGAGEGAGEGTGEGAGERRGTRSRRGGMWRRRGRRRRVGGGRGVSCTCDGTWTGRSIPCLHPTILPATFIALGGVAACVAGAILVHPAFAALATIVPITGIYCQAMAHKSASCCPEPCQRNCTVCECSESCVRCNTYGEEQPVTTQTTCSPSTTSTHPVSVISSQQQPFTVSSIVDTTNTVSPAAYQLDSLYPDQPGHTTYTGVYYSSTAAPPPSYEEAVGHTAASNTTLSSDQKHV